MKIDAFDNTLVFENQDLQTVLEYFKDKRKIPEYIEKSVLKVLSGELFEKEINLESTDEYLMCLPDGFIQKTIADINSMFSSNSKVLYEYYHLSYLLYYLSANIFKVWKPLLDLQLKGTLKPHMRILDIGTGPGSVPIGIIEFYKSLAESFKDISFTLKFVLIEAENKFLSIALKILKSIDNFLPDNLSVSIESLICEKVSGDNDCRYLGKFDLITMSNFLTSNEGENQKNAFDIIKKYKKNLDDYGSFIIIEPGEEKSCKALKRIRNNVVNSKVLNIFSPCIGIWEKKNIYECSCFNMVRCFWELPKIYEFLINRGLSKARRIDVPFNYVVFRNDELKKYDIAKNPQHYTKLSNLKENEGSMINVIALIRTVIYKGEMVSFSLCDGSYDLYEDKCSVWINTSTQQLKKNGINIPLISAEKIVLKRVLVKVNFGRINLELNENTSIRIDY